MSAVTPVLAEKSIPAVLRSACVSAVEATQDRDSADIAARGAPRGHGRALLGSPLPQALKGPNRVAVHHVFVEDASQLALTQDDDVVEARAPDAAEGTVNLSRCRTAQAARGRAGARRGVCSGGSGQAMAARAEAGGDGPVGGEEPLRVPRRLAPAHPSLALARGLVGVLRAVVEPLVSPMLHAGEDIPLGRAIARELVGDRHPRHVSPILEQPGW